MEWIDDRWHCNGKPIHAGTGMEVQWPDGTWQRVRIESARSGRVLLACFDYHGLGLSIRVVGNDDGSDMPLRWPLRSTAARN